MTISQCANSTQRKELKNFGLGFINRKELSKRNIDFHKLTSTALKNFIPSSNSLKMNLQKWRFFFAPNIFFIKVWRFKKFVYI